MTTIHRGIHLGSLGGLGPRRVEVPAARASAPGAPQLIRNGRMALFGAAGGSAIPLMRAGLPGAGRRHSTVKGSTLQSLLSEQVQGGSVSPRAHPDKAAAQVAEDFSFWPSEEGWATVAAIEPGWGAGAGVEENSQLPEHPDLLRGALPNGLRYSIMANKVPGKRVYTNLEVHAGSVDEEDDQQGLAHFLEHMLFLGTEKWPSPDATREVLGKLGMSQLADANAYTDFRSTVYTLSAPTEGVETNRRPRDNVMAARRDTLFRAGLVATPTTIKTTFEEGNDEDEFEEDEEDAATPPPKAAAAGADAAPEPGGKNVGLLLDLLYQMCFKALITEGDVNRERNAVLNEMKDTKDIDDKVATRYYEQMFPETPLPRRFPIGKEDQVKAFTRDDLIRFYRRHYFPSNMHLFVVGDIDPKEVLGEITRLFGDEAPAPAALLEGPKPAGWETPDSPIPTWPKRGSFIAHDWKTAPKNKFQSILHPQLPTFSLTVTTKEKLDSNIRVQHLNEELIDSLIGMALDSRAAERVNAEGDPPLTGIDWFYLNSPREGCVLNSITVSSEARSWRRAVKALAEELGRIVKFGLAPTELDRLTKTLLRQYQQDAEKDETEVSEEKLSHLIDCVESGDAYMSAQQRFDLLEKISPALLLERVNARAASLYGFGCMGEGGAILACAPDSKEMEGMNEESVRALMREGLQDLEPYEDVGEMPEWLMEDGEVDEAFADAGGEKAVLESREVDKEMGITKIRLANGVRLSLKQTKFDRKEAFISVYAVGGRCGEGHVPGTKTGAVVLGMQSALQSGLGPHGPDAVSKYCQLHEIDYDGGSSSEKLALEISASTSEKGAMRRAFEIIHLFLKSPGIDDTALQRVRRDMITRYEANGKILESLTSITLLKLLAHPSTRAAPDPRMVVITPESAEALEKEDLLKALRSELTPSNLEVVILGDFGNQKAVEDLAVKHLGILEGPRRVWDDSETFKKMFHIQLRDKAATAEVFVPEDSERSYVTMAFSTVNRFGVMGDEKGSFDAFPGDAGKFEECMTRHGSMFVSRAVAIAQDVLNNRLYEGIREKGGLVYSVGIEWEPYMYMDVGFVSVSLAPMPDKQDIAIEKVKAIIQEFLKNGFTEEEMSAAKNPTLAEIRESHENNNYWSSLLEGLQSDSALPKTKESIKNIYENYQSLTVEEVMGAARAVFHGFEDRLVVCKGLSGPNITSPNVKIGLSAEAVESGGYKY